MQIFFINYDPYGGCSGVHIHFLANALADRGHNCHVILPESGNDNAYFGTPRYSFLSLDEAVALAARRSTLFRDAILHAWTPRETPRKITQALASATGLPYVIHLEDNERHILESRYGQPFDVLCQRAASGELELNESYCHPLEHQRFLQGAEGVTCIIDALTRFVPEGVPTQVFWPACEDAFFRLPLTPNLKVRAQLGIGPDEIVLTYPGAMHFANIHVMQELYLALPILAEWGRPVRLLRIGGESPDLSSEAAAARDRFVVHLGTLDASRLPPLVGAADILVQPGMPGPFDDCRFPSKLPFFLASGRPVVTAPTNLGRHLRDGEHCLFLNEPGAPAIAAAVRRLIDDPALARRLGDNGRAFARRNLSWDKSAAVVEAFYKRLLRARGGVAAL